jgi:hypothetical protein
MTMADLAPLGFNPAETEDMGDGFKVIPPDIYNVVVVESDVRDNKKGTGKVLVLKYQITDGQQVGNTLTDNLNIQNPSEVSQKIGLSQLKHICDAIGFVGVLKDSNQLHGKPFAVKVVVEQFESNTTPGKMLDSNKVEKRMSIAEAKEMRGIADSAPAAADSKPKASW